MLSLSEINFPLATGQTLTLKSAPGTFTPTGTTKILIEAVQKKIKNPVSLLDLGCGTGVVGLALFMQGLVKLPLCASDLSQSATECCEINLNHYNCQADVQNGSLFEPWEDKRFDVIVDDISAVAEEISNISPWFQGIPCDSGSDGTMLLKEIIESASNHLTDHGMLFFPVVSLSKTEVLLESAKKHFKQVELVTRQQWPLPKEFLNHLPLLERLNKEGTIKLEKQFGMLLWYTEIYCVTNPK